MIQDDYYQVALDEFGAEAQIVMTVEECSELIKALTKQLRGIGKTDNIIHELADVQIMVDQMSYLFGRDEFEFKLHQQECRLMDRLENGEWPEKECKSV